MNPLVWVAEVIFLEHLNPFGVTGEGAPLDETSSSQVEDTQDKPRRVGGHLLQFIW